MLTIHLMEAHEFNPIESVSYKSELADALSNDTSAAQALSLKSMQVVEDTNLKGQNYFISRVVEPNSLYTNFWKWTLCLPSNGQEIHE